MFTEYQIKTRDPFDSVEQVKQYLPIEQMETPRVFFKNKLAELRGITSAQEPSRPISWFKNFTPIEEAPKPTQASEAIQQNHADSSKDRTASTSQPVVTQQQTYTQQKPIGSWIQQMITCTKNSLAKLGLGFENLSKVLAIPTLESGWGKHQSGKNNFGGIKGKTGTTVQTKEEKNGKLVSQKATFQDFNSMQDFTDRLVSLLNDKFDAFNGDFFTKIKGYATSSSYSNQLKVLAKQIERDYKQHLT